MFIDKYEALCRQAGIAPFNFTRDVLKLSHGTYTKWRKGAIPRNTTLKEIADYFGVTTEYLVAEDIEKGNAEIANVSPDKYKLPIYGSISAGHGILADENIIGYAFTDEEYCNDEHFWLSVYGRSMEPMLYNRDLVLIHKQPTLEYGNIGAFIYDGEGFVKKFMPDSNIRLHSLNEKFPDIIIEPEDEDLFRIIGRVIEIKRKV